MHGSEYVPCSCNPACWRYFCARFESLFNVPLISRTRLLRCMVLPLSFNNFLSSVQDNSLPHKQEGLSEDEYHGAGLNMRRVKADDRCSYFVNVNDMRSTCGVWLFFCLASVIHLLSQLAPLDNYRPFVNALSRATCAEQLDTFVTL